MDEQLKKEIIRAYQEKFSSRKIVPAQSFIPVSGKVFDEREMLLMVEAVMDGWWTENRFCKEFDKKICDFLGRKYCVSVNSGSSANLLALACLTSFRLSESKRLKKGDEVITVAAGFPTTINPIIQMGCIPVFIDVEMGTYNPSAQNVKNAISKKTKAIFIAHALGNPFDIDEIAKIAKENNLWLIEDNCDALGSTYKGKYTGTFGHLATLSFYPAHHITLGEGGAVVTDDTELNRILRSIRDWGKDCWCATGENNACKKRFSWKLGDLPSGYDHKYIYSELGYNLKITDIQGALGVAQMEKLPEFIAKRRKNFEYLFNALKPLEKYFILPQWDRNAEPSWFGFPLTIKKELKIKRADLLRFLSDKKIDTRLLFGGNIIKQPYFKNRDIKYRVSGKLGNTDDIMENTFWIGVYPALSKEHLDYIAGALEEFFDKNG